MCILSPICIRLNSEWAIWRRYTLRNDSRERVRMQASAWTHARLWATPRMTIPKLTSPCSCVSYIILCSHSESLKEFSNTSFKKVVAFTPVPHLFSQFHMPFAFGCPQAYLSDSHRLMDYFLSVFSRRSERASARVHWCKLFSFWLLWHSALIMPLSKNSLYLRYYQ